MPRMICDNERCLACRSCELACALQHSSMTTLADVLREDPRTVPRVRLTPTPGAWGFPLRCMQCEEPACVLACMSGALRRDPKTGMARHDPDKCVGCWMCVMVCPFDGLRDLRDRKLVVKCDLCEGEETPACVTACPTHALHLDELIPAEV